MTLEGIVGDIRGRSRDSELDARALPGEAQGLGHDPLCPASTDTWFDSLGRPDRRRAHACGSALLLSSGHLCRLVIPVTTGSRLSCARISWSSYQFGLDRLPRLWSTNAARR